MRRRVDDAISADVASGVGESQNSIPSIPSIRHQPSDAPQPCRPRTCSLPLRCPSRIVAGHQRIHPSYLYLYLDFPSLPSPRPSAAFSTSQNLPGRPIIRISKHPTSHLSGISVGTNFQPRCRPPRPPLQELSTTCSRSRSAPIPPNWPLHPSQKPWDHHPAQ